MAAKKRQKRPPRQVWLTVDDRGDVWGVYCTRAAAKENAVTDARDPMMNERVVGPYVLAERVRER